MNNKFWFLIPLALMLAGCTTCNKKVDTLETRVTSLENTVGIKSEKESTVTTPQETSVASAAAKAEEMTVTDNPTKKDIQSALKNAGFYTGVVDGKFGLMTKKAIEKFQEANGLKADGKVGPNTWDKLKSYLSTSK